MCRKKISMIALLLVLVIVSIFSNFGIMEVRAENIDTKLKEKLVHIKTTKAENGFDDLERLREILKDKKVIGLGESTLGAKEFYEIKHRLVEFLVEEMGYRVFAIDAEFADVKAVNDYINGGEGNINDAIWALRHFSWTATKEKDGSSQIVAHAYLASWTTTEVANMIEWMRKFNENTDNEDRIRFYGIDIELPEGSIEALFEYLYIVDSEMATIYSKKLSSLKKVYSFDVKYPTQRALGLFIGMMEDLEKEFISNKENYIDKTSSLEYDLIEHNLNTIMQWTDYRGINLQLGTKEALDKREYYMSENIKWLLDFEKQFGNDKIIVWAHNRNITKNAKDYISTGKHLSEAFGDEYYAIGLDFYKGRFRAFGVDIWGNPISNYLGKFNIKASPKETLSYKLEQTGIPISFLDFKSAEEDEELRGLLSSEQLFNNIGLMYPGKYVPSKFLIDLIQRYSNNIPMDSYDGFIFIKEISETTGVHDARDTKIKDGDNKIINYYLHIIFGQISTIIAIIIVIILVILVVRNKIRNKKDGKGARYPTSDRWD